MKGIFILAARKRLEIRYAAKKFYINLNVNDTEANQAPCMCTVDIIDDISVEWNCQLKLNEHILMHAGVVNHRDLNVSKNNTADSKGKIR